ncbi:MAG TPA: hypothetical protein VNM90_04610 [Haliangium sp.]|nr:hypothetical protein [Haliangium sp.]
MTVPTRLAAFLLVLAACAGPPAPQPVAPAQPASAPAAQPTPAAQPAPTPAPPAPGPAQAQPQAPAAASPRTESFGDKRWGFVEASSANGRFAVLRRFHGDARPSFGHHGESADQPEVTVFDRVTGQERTISEIIDIDATRRFLLLLADGALWLADAETGNFESLAGTDMDPDGNACLSPRQATFSAKGKRVAWVTDKSGSLTVRDLATGATWRIAAKQRIWRGWPDDDGRGGVVLEVPAGTGWPEQHTSCACRWCNRFALSYGVYGWGGPSFTIERVAEDGSRSQGEPPEGEGVWHGKTTSGCELKPQSEDSGLERGPWQWRCP